MNIGKWFRDVRYALADEVTIAQDELLRHDLGTVNDKRFWQRVPGIFAQTPRQRSQEELLGLEPGSLKRRG
jgi:hypothetical protein